MPSNAEINLGETVHPELAGDVNEERDLNAVGLLQRDGVEGASPSGSFPGERLADFAEAGI
jgi:hypothetical protein